jgi:hypothetical protein
MTATATPSIPTRVLARELIPFASASCSETSSVFRCWSRTSDSSSRPSRAIRNARISYFPDFLFCVARWIPPLKLSVDGKGRLFCMTGTDLT